MSTPTGKSRQETAFPSVLASGTMLCSSKEHVYASAHASTTGYARRLALCAVWRSLHPLCWRTPRPQMGGCAAQTRTTAQAPHLGKEHPACPETANTALP